MSAVICNPLLVMVPAQTGRVSPSTGGLTVGVFRLPTDPLFYADLTLRNIVVGSRYRVTRTSTGGELATGVAAATDVTISGIPCYSNPMAVEIVVRKGTSATKYLPLEVQTEIAKTGGAAFLSQVPDPIA